MPSPITDEEERLIIKMWGERKTGSEIGAAVGRSRNSIMGKLNRLRAKGVIKLLPEGEARFKPKGEAKAPTPAIRQKAPSMPKMPHLKTDVAPVDKAPVEKLFVTLPIKEEPTEPIRFSDLKYMSCRYVVSGKRAGEFLFCGKTKTKKSYCAEHSAIVYVRAEKKRPNPVNTFKLEQMSGFLNK